MILRCLQPAATLSLPGLFFGKILSIALWLPWGPGEQKWWGSKRGEHCSVACGNGWNRLSEIGIGLVWVEFAWRPWELYFFKRWGALRCWGRSPWVGTSCLGSSLISHCCGYWRHWTRCSIHSESAASITHAPKWGHSPFSLLCSFLRQGEAPYFDFKESLILNNSKRGPVRSTPHQITRSPLYCVLLLVGTKSDIGLAFGMMKSWRHSMKIMIDLSASFKPEIMIIRSNKVKLCKFEPRSSGKP